MIFICIFTIIAILFNADIAIAGARNGIELCIYTVIPALFPYCALSIWLRSMLSYNSIKILRPFEKYFNMPRGTGMLWILGLLGGYPIGAICVEQAYSAKGMSLRQSKYMRPICNNAGPSFIIGIAAFAFHNKTLPCYLLLIQALSSLMACLILSNATESSLISSRENPLCFTDALRQALLCMGNICATVIIFKVFLSIGDYYSGKFVRQEIWTILTGFIELTNGSVLLGNIAYEAKRFIMAAGMLSFGGLCVHMQTASVSSPGTYKCYLFCVLLKTIISILFAIIFIKVRRFYWFIIIYILLLSVIKLLKHIIIKKTVAIRKKVLYNGSTS